MRKLTINQVKEIIQNYNDGMSNQKLATKFGVHRSTIANILKKNRITLRKSSPQKEYNVHFFDEYNEISTYWAGFLLADGNISKNKRVVNLTLSLIDDKHLQKFAICTKYNGNFYTDKKNNAKGIQFCGEWFPISLEENYSIINNKSLICKFPKQLPEFYYKNFIRGIYDGDGSIWNNKNNILIGFTGTVELLSELRYIFQTKLEIFCKNSSGLHSIQKNKKNSLIGSLTYSGKNAEKILTWLYDGSTQETRLDRKYNKYFEYFIKETGDSLI